MMWIIAWVVLYAAAVAAMSTGWKARLARLARSRLVPCSYRRIDNGAGPPLVSAPLGRPLPSRPLFVRIWRHESGQFAQDAEEPAQEQQGRAPPRQGLCDQQ